MDYAITDGFASSDQRRADPHRAQRADGLNVTAEQFDQIKPALDTMCEQMKRDHRR